MIGKPCVLMVRLSSASVLDPPEVDDAEIAKCAQSSTVRADHGVVWDRRASDGGRIVS